MGSNVTIDKGKCWQLANIRLNECSKFKKKRMLALLTNLTSIRKHGSKNHTAFKENPTKVLNLEHYKITMLCTHNIPTKY